ncbi:hypothetical protein HYT23_04010 [Candidatus Pacearchaeota archaeon]|nr:hypothetical protein [Candidatus Pacearchaeota archaeon]
MDLYSFIIGNKESIKLIYALIIIFICALIVTRSDRLFRLSEHNGIRYFRNAFLFYGLGFAFRYFLDYPLIKLGLYSQLWFLTEIFFEFFLVMGGFFLLYSLIWTRLESIDEKSSLLSGKIAIFYAMSIVIILMDFLWPGFNFMFLVQTTLFFVLSALSYSNYRKNGSRRKFPKFYFIAMLLGLFAWILNTLASFFFSWNQAVMINVYAFNLIFFLLFLYGVIRVTKT